MTRTMYPPPRGFSQGEPQRSTGAPDNWRANQGTPQQGHGVGGGVWEAAPRDPPGPQAEGARPGGRGAWRGWSLSLPDALTCASTWKPELSGSLMRHTGVHVRKEKNQLDTDAPSAPATPLLSAPRGSAGRDLNRYAQVTFTPRVAAAARRLGAPAVPVSVHPRAEKQNVADPQNGMLFRLKKEGRSVTRHSMGAPEGIM